MRSIEEVGLHEPIDVLEVDGQYYGFSGCHRFEASAGAGAVFAILCGLQQRQHAGAQLKLQAS